MTIIFDNKKSFSYDEINDMKLLLKGSPFDWILSKSDRFGYKGMAEYRAKYEENGQPVILQAMCGCPSSEIKEKGKLTAINWAGFKNKLAALRQSIEKKEFCSFCNKNHIHSFNRVKYCILAEEQKHSLVAKG